MPDGIIRQLEGAALTERNIVASSLNLPLEIAAGEAPAQP